MTQARAATRGVRLAAALLTITLLAGCERLTPSGPPAGSGNPAGTPNGESPAASQPGSSPADVAALAALGITVVDGSGEPIVAPAAPDVPIVLAARQLDLLFHAARNGVGFLGADLDSLTAPTEGLRTMSAGLAELIRSGEGPGAAYARTLMPSLDVGDPSTVVFPTLALLAIQADLLREQGVTAAQAPTGGGARLATWNVLEAKGECDRFLSGTQPWVDALVEKVINAYLASTPESTMAPGVLSAYLIGPDIGAAGIDVLRQRLLTIYLIGYLATLYPPWTPELTADPAETRKAIGDEPAIGGEVTVAVVDPITPERLELVECAKRNGVRAADTLSLTSFFHHPVVWTLEQTPGGLAVNDTALAMDESLASGPDRTVSPDFSRVYAETHLDDAGKLTLRYHTTSEPDADGEERVGTLTVHAKVERPEWAALLDELNGGWFRTFYPALENVVQDQIRLDVVRSNLEHAVATIDSILTTSKASIAIPVTYHESGQLAAPDPCSLITHAEAEAVAGVPVRPGERRPAEFSGGRMGEMCLFISTQAPGDAPITVSLVRVSVVDLGADAASLFDTFKAAALAEAEVAAGSIGGLAEDDLYVADPGGAAALWVRRKNIVIVVNVITADGLAQATVIARRALTRF